MAMSQRYLGGETGRRSIFGAGVRRTRTVGLVVVFCVFVVLTPIAAVPGVVGCAIAALVVVGATTNTPLGSPLQRWQTSRAWKERQRNGLVEFRPVATRPVDLEEAMASGSRSQRSEARREFNIYRDWADGAQGFQWLLATPSTPGIGWHTPTGEDAWLSVVFPIGGQVAGLESDPVLDGYSRAFGAMLATMGTHSSRHSRLQLITRVQPVDTANHEAWVASQVDRNAPAVLLHSYKEVVERLGTGGLMQRHFAVVRWPLSPAFLAAAGRAGSGQRGWRLLMGQEIDSVWRQLGVAGLNPGKALSAAQVTAVMRHLQHPSWPIDQAGDVDPTQMWLPSVDEWSFTRVTAPGPGGDLESWFHRTAVVPVDKVETSPRNALWMMPMLSHMRDRVVRTISVQLEGVPQRVARNQAKDDMTSDLADERAQREKGVLVDEDLTTGLEAARARRDDLRPGRGHQGLGWAMHITVSARTREELREACELMTEAASGSGIEQLEWFEGKQAAAQACTWPLARGMKPVDAGAGAWVMTRFTGTGHKESLT